MDFCPCDIKNWMTEHVARMTDVRTGKGVLVGKYKTKGATPKREDNIKPLKPTGYYVYHQFNIHKSYILPTQLYLCVLCGSQNKQLLFPYTALTGWFL